ncbi:SMP-30/gluconolactonase/LRE family protein [Vannielia litorea]|uniref:SMP-30/gluconolactonase/LRE family protein n=1 Tax=Vannielia litorea TaxID=1217970 RepID=UPI001C945A7B|nr:SMP-30/gluconolactonase/LRE family protein [Vannielia litorea]MBY6048911.1 SMP-30/gluconolactonase/LRE family protein [Vannielia litorea]MBY6076325.1 SMP-30/gluconolactonase/LRE family protein [Vannielia litorea]
MTVSVDVAVPARAQLGEGPVWDVGDQALWWADISGGKIHRTGEDGSDEAFDFGEPVGCVARREAGGLIVAAKSGFYLYDPETLTKTFLTDPEADRPGNRFNDGGTDMQGRFWAGTMKDGGDPEQLGQFYRYGTDGSVTPFFDKVYTTNGLAFSPDGTTLYYSDSNPLVRTIWACDYDTESGTPSNRKVFFDTREVAGRPDGGTVDADGCYWMAGISGAQLVRITPQGKVDRIIDMPVERPTKPMFGGRNLDILYVTSIGSDAPDALDGNLFAVTGLGVTGVEQARFAG